VLRSVVLPNDEGRKIEGRSETYFAWIEEPTKLNDAFAFLPSVVIAARHTTMMSDNITAYSTAVGPSSRFRKFATRLAIHWDNFFIISPYWNGKDSQFEPAMQTRPSSPMVQNSGGFAICNDEARKLC